MKQQEVSIETISSDLEELLSTLGEWEHGPQDPFPELVDTLCERMEGKKIGPDDQPYLISIEGTTPLMLSCVHGGIVQQELSFQERDYPGPYGRDKRAKEFTLLLAYLMDKHLGLRPHVLVNELNRRYIDLNRDRNDPLGDFPYADEALSAYYDFYYSTLHSVYGKVLHSHDGGLHLAWHTCSTDRIRRKICQYFAQQHGATPLENPDQILYMLPYSMQHQISSPIVFGTHLRATIDPIRAIDNILSQEYSDFEIHGMNRGMHVFVPHEKDQEMFLGGKHEITQALQYKRGERLPIDSIQIEVKAQTYNKAFDHLLFLSIRAMQEALRHY